MVWSLQVYRARAFRISSCILGLKKQYMHCNTHCVSSLARNFQEPEEHWMPRRRESIIHCRRATAKRRQKRSRDLRPTAVPARARQRQLTAALTLPSIDHGFEFVQARELCSACVEWVGSPRPRSCHEPQHHPTDPPPGPLKRACRKAWLKPSRPATRSDMLESLPGH